MWKGGFYIWVSGSVALCEVSTFGGLPRMQQQELCMLTQRAGISAQSICLSTVTYPYERYQNLRPLSSATRRCNLQHVLVSQPSVATSGAQTICSSMITHPKQNPNLLPLSAPLHCNVQHVLSNQPSIATLASILRHCGETKALLDGILVHKHIKKQGFCHNIFLDNCLVLMYAQCESMENAQQVFDKIARPNSYSWSILIKGYALNGKVDEARHLLAQIPNPDVVAFNTMIAAYAEKQQGKKALDLFWKMQANGMDPDTITLTCTLEACYSFTNLGEAEEFLAYINKSKFAEDKSVQTALITLLGKFGMLDDGWEIFSNLRHRDVVSWNAMIAAYAQNGHCKKALSLYFKMLLQGMVASPTTLGCALDACTSLLDLEEGLHVHVIVAFYGYDRDCALGISLIHMYGKCGCLIEARDSFNRIVSHNVVSWTALMSACVDGNGDEEALDVFFRMQHHGFDPNEVTFTCVLDACARLAVLEVGFSLHAAIVHNAHEHNKLVGTALVYMYGKCGLVNNARSVFNKICQKDIAAWNTMLTICAQSGRGKEALNLFDEMLVAGFRPTDVSFTCVLTVCSQMGQIDDGRKYFMSLHKNHSLPPTSEHFSCMIDLLSRAGCLEEAEALLDCFPLTKLASLWTSLLAACKTHGDVHRGFRAADQFSELDPRDPGPFVALANICATGTDIDQGFMVLN